MINHSSDSVVNAEQLNVAGNLEKQAKVSGASHCAAWEMRGLTLLSLHKGYSCIGIMALSIFAVRMKKLSMEMFSAQRVHRGDCVF